MRCNMFSHLAVLKFFLYLPFFCIFCSAIDILTPTRSIRDGENETLTSPDQVFELGFFSPGNSENRYLGIWYKRTPEVVVWVANRNISIQDSNGTLSLSNDGTLLLLNGTGYVIWNAKPSKEATLGTPIAQLLVTGNFVLMDNSSSGSKGYLWQSFDFPTNTRLPGMIHGIDRKTGIDHYFTSWKSPDDPSPGALTYRIDYHALPQTLLLRGSKRITRSGIWNGLRFSGLPVYSTSAWPPTVVLTNDNYNTMYEPYYDNISRRVVIDEPGLILRYVLNEKKGEWTLMNRLPNDPCDYYGQCGANGICRDNRLPICQCLEGFVPKSPQEWAALTWDSGCVRAVPLGCQSDGFLKVEGVKLPDLLQFKINSTMNLVECEAECLKRCNCTAYSNLNISGGGSGCLIWFGDLIDIREFIQEDSQQIIYIRLAASQLKSIKMSDKKRLTIIVVLAVLLPGIFLLAIVTFVIWKKRKARREYDSEEDMDLPLLGMVSIAAATSNFSQENLIGAGGFGSVYKGILPEGQDIAVKRLSRDSTQGLQEFKNEVRLIAKLQHRNLVRLLGCCIQGEERMLIYEYMPNKSLDNFIFDRKKSSLLKWQNRNEIIIGVARGLLYLHQDSRLTIIHRDLKASNVLLDSNLKPKIADFGLARIFGGDQSEVRTNRVIGTYGYMSPEYAIDGKFSTKSDVFSFGVLLLEIVSGKRNRGFRHPDHQHSLLGHAWMLWKEGDAMELIDPCLKGSCNEAEVLRCINVGLLCVQKLSDDRPEMSSVLFMLSNLEAHLPHPKKPGFFVERTSGTTDASSSTGEFTENAFSTTVVEAR